MKKEPQKARPAKEPLSARTEEPQKPVYTAVVEANRRAQREVAISLGRTLKSEAAPTAPKETPPAHPQMFRGAQVVRGLGMKADDLEAFAEQRALSSFDATREMWIVVEDNALEDLDRTTEIAGFSDRNDAIHYAQALAAGNVDQRVLRVTDQVLVVGTLNEAP